MTTVRTLSALDGEPHARVFPDAEPKTIRLTLAADEAIPAHMHPDCEIVLYLVSGKLALRVGDETDTLEAGDVARFDGGREISPRAIEASTALLVLAPRA
ncbi:cupin domain-containing protein [Halonotius terrestris]|uniref:Cupin domain-containing protein n=1 Tax=Halonotius terrestris TaxID=2487750 RepID=A0A8J8PC21_9EURY|nr:cupin domain-containing protein [Halonotius terrestris]TQQ83629.1 cupin domain-containing protein [Halonotius terrestris]